MQIKINRLLVILVGFVLLGIGCAPDTSQNNRMNVSNQNSSNQTAAENKTLPPPSCTSVSEAELKDEINRLPAPLKNQFKEVNPQSGTISLSYAANILIFRGYITGNGNNLRGLLERFDRFRSPQCVKKVLFQGETEAENFEWRPETVSPPPGGTPSPTPNTCKRDVEDAINNSNLASQLNKNLKYTFDETTKVLTFSGYIGDIPGNGQNGQFNSLIARLQQFMSNGCISKIVFTNDGIKTEEKLTAERGFGWELCEPPLCECAGICTSNCPCV